jgi:hypothetical protein
MADIGVKQSWLVSETWDVEKKWIEVQIQERKSRIVRYKQDIEDLQKGKIVDLEARIMMLEKEIKKLQSDLENRRQAEVVVNGE